MENITPPSNKDSHALIFAQTSKTSLTVLEILDFTFKLPIYVK